MANMRVVLFFILILLFFSTFETRSIDRISHRGDRSLIESAQEMLKESIVRHELIGGFNKSFRLSPGAIRLTSFDPMVSKNISSTLSFNTMCQKLYGYIDGSTPMPLILQLIVCGNKFQSGGGGEFMSKQLQSHFINVVFITNYHVPIPQLRMVEAFSTIVFIINRLPMLVLIGTSPFEILYGKAQFTLSFVYSDASVLHTYEITTNINLSLEVFLAFFLDIIPPTKAFDALILFLIEYLLHDMQGSSFGAIDTLKAYVVAKVSRGRHLRQLVVKNAFLHGVLQETMYMEQPSCYVNPSLPNHVCRLHKAIYGLKQTPRNTESLIDKLIKQLNTKFSMKDLDSFHYFSALEVTHSATNLFLSQVKYEKDLVLTNLLESKPVGTSMVVSHHLTAEGTPFPSITTYHSLVGALQYLTITRPDISHVVNSFFQFMHAPKAHHLHAVKSILRYVKGTLHFGLLISPSTNLTISTFSDANWAGCPDTSRSTSGCAIFLDDNLVSWTSKKQPTVS
uniref:Reverse transcriptase Ty1/copia-type domain-containing protein n=1 Tax=Salix viminalis TaxID=40686 RepID=A0A6N2ND41_SALVM